MRSEIYRTTEPFCVSPSDSLTQVVSKIDRGGQGIALVVDSDLRLVGTITDGDVRRAVLTGINLDSMTAENLLQTRPAPPNPTPLTAGPNAVRRDLIRLMDRYEVQHIPIVAENGVLIGLAVQSDLLGANSIDLEAVIMAGGRGSRLRPMTDDVPKPMLRIGGVPVLERIIHQLRSSGIRKIYLTTHFKAEVIYDYFGDGGRFGVEIDYVHEDEPLGTAGGIGLIGQFSSRFVIINADVLSELDFATMLDFHVEQEAFLTVAATEHRYEVPFGVLEHDNGIVTALSEKPDQVWLVNAGVYLAEPELVDHLVTGQALDMDDLVENVIEAGRRVVSFPLWENWRDIGRPADLRFADDEAKASNDPKRQQDERIE